MSHADRMAMIEAETTDVNPQMLCWYDKSEDKYWDEHKTLVASRGIDCISKAHWYVGNDGKKIRPSVWLASEDSGRTVHGTTYVPGQPELIENVDYSDGDISTAPGKRLLNLWRPPAHSIQGDAHRAQPFFGLVYRLFGNGPETESFLDLCADIAQNPGKKGNAVVVLGGRQGIGKDALLTALCKAIQSAAHIQPDELFSQYNGYASKLMVCINEMRPFEADHSMRAFYEKLKVIGGAPPETLFINQKYRVGRWVPNLCRVFITTNDLLSVQFGQTDRRILVLESRLPFCWHEQEDPKYFVRYFRWLEEENGAAHLYAALMQRDLSEYDRGSSAIVTAAKEKIAAASNYVPEALYDALETLGHPDLLFTNELIEAAFDEADEIKSLLKHPRKLQRFMADAGYDIVYRHALGKRIEFEHNGKRMQIRTVFGKESSMPMYDWKERAKSRANAILSGKKFDER